MNIHGLYDGNFMVILTMVPGPFYDHDKTII